MDIECLSKIPAKQQQKMLQLCDNSCTAVALMRRNLAIGIL